MPVPTVKLTGDAVTGYVREGATPPRVATKLPATLPVKLGRIPTKESVQCADLDEFFDAEAGDVSLPEETSWGKSAQASIRQPYGNTSAGCCVISEAMHVAGIQTSNNPADGSELIGSDREALVQYRNICGPGDNGCNMVAVLEHRRSKGITVGGVVCKVDDYCRIDCRNWDLVRFAIAKLGPIAVGFSLPRDWLGMSVWDTTNSPIVGGHDVAAVDFNEDGVIVASWGREYLFTREAFTSGRYIDEAYVPLSPHWYGRDDLAPSGLNVQGLRDALSAVRGGVVPPDPPTPIPPNPIPDPPPNPGPTPPVPVPTPPVPTPPVPVPVPTPPEWIVRLEVRDPQSGDVRHTVSGTISAAVPVPVTDTHTITMPSPQLAECLTLLLVPVVGVRTKVDGSKITLTRKGLTPEQWARLIDAAIRIAEIVARILADQ